MSSKQYKRTLFALFSICPSQEHGKHECVVTLIKFLLCILQFERMKRVCDQYKSLRERSCNWDMGGVIGKPIINFFLVVCGFSLVFEFFFFFFLLCFLFWLFSFNFSAISCLSLQQKQKVSFFVLLSFSYLCFKKSRH